MTWKQLRAGARPMLGFILLLTLVSYVDERLLPAPWSVVVTAVVALPFLYVASWLTALCMLDARDPR